MSKIPILDLKPQYNSIKVEIQAAINRVLESGQFILGEDVRLLEQEIATYLGVKHAIAVNSGTDALIIGLRTLGIGHGDEVITTPFSFFATAESISNVGATPVFVDVDINSFNINPRLIKAKITDRTKAIMPVHLFGYPAAMTQILEIAKEYNLKVIEDCAQSFGARYYGDCGICKDECDPSIRNSIQNKFTGAIADLGAFSFFPTKNLGAYGDGGVITTNCDRTAELSQMLRVHGSQKRYHNEMFGYNSRLDSIQAAILRVKLPHLDQWNQERRRVAETYNQLLADVPNIITPAIPAGHVFHQYTIRVTGGKRDQVAQNLLEMGIGNMIYYPIPQDLLPVYKGKYPTNPVSELLAAEVLSLPIWAELDATAIARVAEGIKKALK
ncbi:putative PLP-dependent enzyme possibly involved in cell wall biogenesis [Synechococcus sp. PCC 7502]|uniref:DegT/DnrJ/EryC1/StrS family aminotransferase n=1 Tax=Synechococcus sp. PCC 7502 TaxID=1173263 RepID=UPI00029FC7AB|nr:DegT/DnrJ/EryC1/StrS family aminotransferase [Synechococcus sp. PCC 7502]AFY75392.1 putative PLP-dependent enzyme possibly involved in cell wall biogenesis [Synechococcus sp. PCC 7502]